MDRRQPGTVGMVRSGPRQGSLKVSGCPECGRPIIGAPWYLEDKWELHLECCTPDRIYRAWGGELCLVSELVPPPDPLMVWWPYVSSTDAKQPEGRILQWSSLYPS
jgi:hypothetical protein